MALDTANKRQSAIHMACPWRSLIPFPTGSVEQVDRITTAFMYSGVTPMAAGGVNTVGKRMGALHLACPWRSIIPFPDGTVDDTDRPIIAFMYPHVAAMPGGGGVDTMAKRMGAMNMASPWRSIIPFPDGSVDAADRVTIRFMYPQTFLSPPAAGTKAWAWIDDLHTRN